MPPHLMKRRGGKFGQIPSTTKREKNNAKNYESLNAHFGSGGDCVRGRHGEPDSTASSSDYASKYSNGGRA
jgi:hypothetical protein